MSEFFTDPAWIDLDQRPRTVSFENPSGSAGTAGASFVGRKGAARQFVEAGERVTLADLNGPGRIGHFWMTVAPMLPEQLRALVLEVFYDGRIEPSISVPIPDFFGATLGRPISYQSALQSTQEGRGFNSWIPMPFRDHVRVELVNASRRRVDLYYQLDLTLGPVADEVGLLHASFRRENPTTIGEDFTIAGGFVGPGRFLGCNVGVRVFHEPAYFVWYGEGEVKMFLDDDGDLPTWCGTGLEDYVGTAFGMGAHQTSYQGAPMVLANPSARTAMPDLVGFYRWHLPDPIVFERRLRVTIQQIGAVFLRADQAELRTEIEASGRLVGGGWRAANRDGTAIFGICEREDDYCATAYVYCRDAQPVACVDAATAVADIGRFDYETASPFETALADPG